MSAPDRIDRFTVTRAADGRWLEGVDDAGTTFELLPIPDPDRASWEWLRAAAADAAVPEALVAGPSGTFGVRRSFSNDFGALRGPHAPSVVAAIAVRLVDPVRRAAPVLPPGAPSDDDLRIDDQGHPILAPNRLARGGDEAAALRALASVLHRLAVGEAPPGARLAPPPPALAGALDDLGATDPARREAAVAALHALAGPLPDLRRLVRTPPGRVPTAARTDARAAPGAGGPSLAVRTTAGPGGAPARGRRDDGDRVFAVVPASRLDAAARSALAADLGVPASVIDDLASTGGPIPVAPGGSREAITALARAHPAGPSVVGPGGFGLLALGAGVLAVAGALAVVGVGLAFAWWVAGAVTLAAAGVTALAGAASVGAGAARRSAHADARRAAAAVSAARSLLEDPTFGPARAAIVRARGALARADLPDPAERDVRASLDALDEHLDANPDADGARAILDAAERLTAELEGSEALPADVARSAAEAGVRAARAAADARAATDALGRARSRAARREPT